MLSQCLALTAIFAELRGLMLIFTTSIDVLENSHQIMTPSIALSRAASRRLSLWDSYVEISRFITNLHQTQLISTRHCSNRLRCFSSYGKRFQIQPDESLC